MKGKNKVKQQVRTKCAWPLGLPSAQMYYFVFKIAHAANMYMFILTFSGFFDSSSLIFLQSSKFYFRFP
jgi:hypothetical protein